MARLTGQAALDYIKNNPSASYVDNKTGQRVERQKSGLEKFAMGVFQPFRAGAGVAQEAGYTLADLYNLIKGNNQEVGKRPENYIGMTPEESKALYEDPLKVGLKSGVGVMSYGLGGGANTAATTLGRIGQAVGKGAVAGSAGGFGYSKSGEELGSTLKGGALGGLIGGALQGVGEIGRKAGEKASQPVVNEKLIKGSASKLKLSPEEFKQETTNVLQDMADKGFDISSPKKIANNYKSYLNMVQKEAQSAGKLSQQVMNVDDIKAIYNAKKPFLKSSIGVEGEFKKITTDLFAKPTLKLDDVLQYKMTVDKLGGGIQKLEKSGKYLSEVMNDIRNETRSLVSGDELVDSALSRFSSALKLKDTILKNPEVTQMMGMGGILPIHFGANVRPMVDALRPSGLGQKIAQGPIGKTQQFLGKIASPAGDATGFLKGMSLKIAIPGVVGLGMQAEPKVATTGTLGTLGDTTSGAQTTPQVTLQDALIMAMQTMPGASESEIMSLAKMYMDQGSGTGLKVGAKDKSNAISGLNSLNQLEELLNSGLNLTPQILGQGNTSAMIGSSEYKQYQALAKNVADIIARVRTGAQINEKEMTLYMKEFLPLWFDDVATKQVKLKQVRDYLTGISTGQITPEYLTTNVTTQ